MTGRDQQNGNRDNMASEMAERPPLSLDVAVTIEDEAWSEGLASLFPDLPGAGEADGYCASLQDFLSDCLEAALADPVTRQFLEKAAARGLAGASGMLQGLYGHDPVYSEASDAVEVEEVELGLLLTGDAEIRDLNARYRDRDRATNVLSFAMAVDGDSPVLPGMPLNLGDLVLARETVFREAEEAGRPVADHFRHLLLHGLLHLLGQDHETGDTDATAMEACEVRILAGHGIANPYASPDESRGSAEPRP